jgi:hypothetical protein
MFMFDGLYRLACGACGLRRELGLQRIPDFSRRFRKVPSSTRTACRIKIALAIADILHTDFGMYKDEFLKQTRVNRVINETLKASSWPHHFGLGVCVTADADAELEPSADSTAHDREFAHGANPDPKAAGAAVPPKAAGSVLIPACLPCSRPKRACSMGLERMSTIKLRQRARVASTHVVLC